jgi:hypothetical protein
MSNKPSTFREVYELLRQSGPAHVTSRRGTVYTVEAGEVSGRPAIIGYPASGRIVIHDDCWQDNKTCQSTWAGGLYHGPYSIIDWYNEHKGKG